MSQGPASPLDQVGTPVTQPSRDWVWVLGILAGCFLVLTLACCGVGYLLWYQASGALTNAMAQQYSDHPVIVEHIGEITDSGMDMKTRPSEDDEESVNVEFSIELEGDKGSGKIVFRSGEGGEGENVLVLDDGREFPLDDPMEDSMDAAATDDEDTALEATMPTELESQETESEEASG